MRLKSSRFLSDNCKLNRYAIARVLLLSFFLKTWFWIRKRMKKMEIVSQKFSIKAFSSELFEFTSCAREKWIEINFSAVKSFSQPKKRRRKKTCGNRKPKKSSHMRFGNKYQLLFFTSRCSNFFILLHDVKRKINLSGFYSRLFMYFFSAVFSLFHSGNFSRVFHFC